MGILSLLLKVKYDLLSICLSIMELQMRLHNQTDMPGQIWLPLWTVTLEPGICMKLHWVFYFAHFKPVLSLKKTLKGFIIQLFRIWNILLYSLFYYHYLFWVFCPKSTHTYNTFLKIYHNWKDYFFHYWIIYFHDFFFEPSINSSSAPFLTILLCCH